MTQEPNRGLSEASRVIWDWRADETQDEQEDSAASLRVAGLLQSAAAFAVSCLFWYFDVLLIAYIAAFMGTLVLLLSLLSPRGLFAAFRRAMEGLAEKVGLMLSWILLPAIFYTFFVPFGALFRRGKRDAMKRFYDPGAASYWVERDRDLGEEGSRMRQF